MDPKEYLKQFITSFMQGEEGREEAEQNLSVYLQMKTAEITDTITINSDWEQENS